MKTVKKRALALLMAVLVVMTTVFGNEDYSVKAEETTKTVAAWEYTEDPNLTFPAAATTGNGKLYLTDGVTYTGYSSGSLCAKNWAVGAGWTIEVDA